MEPQLSVIIFEPKKNFFGVFFFLIFIFYLLPFSSFSFSFLVDFVIPNPGVSLVKEFDARMELAKKSVCDYAFHVAVTWWSDQVHEEMGIIARERGVNSFKHFMAYKVR